MKCMAVIVIYLFEDPEFYQIHLQSQCLDKSQIVTMRFTGIIILYHISMFVGRIYSLLQMTKLIQQFTTVKFKFRLRDGTLQQVQAEKGTHLLQIAKKCDAGLEGACEASLACSTCHVILPSQIYAKLDSPSDEEEDLLDLAFGLTETSRLGCQVSVTEIFEGATVTVPRASRNMYVDGSKPTSH